MKNSLTSESPRLFLLCTVVQHVGFMVEKAALGQVFSYYFGSPANHSTDFAIIIITRG
jgi:hypothetical protein